MERDDTLREFEDVAKRFKVIVIRNLCWRRSPRSRNFQHRQGNELFCTGHRENSSELLVTCVCIFPRTWSWFGVRSFLEWTLFQSKVFLSSQLPETTNSHHCAETTWRSVVDNRMQCRDGVSVEGAVLRPCLVHRSMTNRALWAPLNRVDLRADHQQEWRQAVSSQKMLHQT